MPTLGLSVTDSRADAASLSAGDRRHHPASRSVGDASGPGPVGGRARAFDHPRRSG